MATPDIALRSVQSEDGRFLLRLFATTREDLALARLPEEQQDALIRMQFRSQAAHFSGLYPNADHSLIVRGHELIGRLYVDRDEARIHIVDIALLPEHRNAGIGSRLVRELFEEGDATGRPVRLHVARSNRAAELYRRLGFVAIGGDDVYLLMERAPSS